MHALAATGNFAAASRVYRELRLRLQHELGIEPDPETVALYERLGAEARCRAASGGASLLLGREAGSGGSRITHSRASRASLATGEAPAAGGEPPNNLPLPLTSFVGREWEMGELKEILAGGRLATLTGAGGCGKSRLALEAAFDLFPAYLDGAWLVELASLADPALVLAAVAAALGVREEPHRPLTETLREHLKPRQLLLILDNCEHLVEACAQLAEVLLSHAPGVQILATSREPIGIGGEVRYRVPSLSLPEGSSPLWEPSRDREGAVSDETLPTVAARLTPQRPSNPRPSVSSWTAPPRRCRPSG
jgi:hypothetical protein